MREILFRGQTRKFGEKVGMDGKKLPGNWVYGGIFPGTGDFSVIYGGANENELKKYLVYSDTVGQYTGLTDRNGVKIFEGDIIRRFDGKVPTGNFVIRWSESCCGFNAGEGKCMWPNLNQATIDAYKVVGNIHDNPKLLSS